MSEMSRMQNKCVTDNLSQHQVVREREGVRINQSVFQREIFPEGGQQKFLNSDKPINVFHKMVTTKGKAKQAYCGNFIGKIIIKKVITM